MFQKSIVLFVVALLALATAEKITFGSRQAGDTLLRSSMKTTMPTSTEGKHELIVGENDITCTYVEFNVYPVSSSYSSILIHFVLYSQSISPYYRLSYLAEC